jgi:hypothetical protein
MESTATVKKTYWPAQWSINYRASFPLKPFHGAIVLDTALRRILPSEVFTNKPVLNLKGRDSSVVLAPGTPSSALPKGEELLFIKGAFIRGKSKDDLIDFKVRLSSEFLDFPSARAIQHTIASISTGVPEFLPIQRLGVAFPVKLDRIRFGLDHFTAQRGSLLSGVGPVVTESLRVDIAHDELFLEIDAERLPSKDTIPFETGGKFSFLCHSIKAASEVDLLNDFKQKVLQGG